MPTERAIVETLNRKDLQALVSHFEVPVADRRARDGMVQALVASRKVRLPALLAQLPLASLKALCAAHDLEEGGRQKAVLVERLLDATKAKASKPKATQSKVASAKPAAKAKPAASKSAAKATTRKGSASKAASKTATPKVAASKAAVKAATPKTATPKVAASKAAVKAATPKVAASKDAAPQVLLPNGAKVATLEVAPSESAPKTAMSASPSKPAAKAPSLKVAAAPNAAAEHTNPAPPTNAAAPTSSRPPTMKPKPTLVAVPDPAPVAALTPQGMTPLNPSKVLDWPQNLPTSPMPHREVPGPALTPRASKEICITCAASIDLRKCSVQRCDNHIIVTPTRKICAECMFERNTLSMDEFMQKLQDESTCPHCGQAWKVAS